MSKPDPVANEIHRIAHWWSRKLEGQQALTRELRALVEIAQTEDPNPRLNFVLLVELLMPTDADPTNLAALRLQVAEWFPQYEWYVTEADDEGLHSISVRSKA